MARAAPKTVRFTQVVERSGRPHVHTLWLPPEKDPEFKRARDAHRVMTIEQTPGGGRADIGMVGFDPRQDHGGQFLIFPKSLKPFEGARVVGVKFDLVEQPKLTAAKKLQPTTLPRRAKSPRPKPERIERRPGPPQPPHHAPEAPKEPRPAAAPTLEKKISPGHAALIREVRAAMQDLQRGKAVAAYQRLERALR